MKINPCKKADLSEKTDYPTAGWLNQNHDSLQEMKLEKIDPVKNQGEYVVDPIFCRT